MVKLESNGREIGEVDILARDSSGECWAVEVKSGYADISGVRQAYVNSLLLRCRPMLIARTYSNDDVLELAEKLGVELKFLDDIFVSDPVELEILIHESLLHSEIELIKLWDCMEDITPRTAGIIRTLAGNPDSLSYESLNALVEDNPCLKELLYDRKKASLISRFIVRYILKNGY